jgi:hypothetical protein
MEWEWMYHAEQRGQGRPEVVDVRGYMVKHNGHDRRAMHEQRDPVLCEPGRQLRAASKRSVVLACDDADGPTSAAAGLQK